MNDDRQPGVRLREARRNSGLTQQELADALKVDKITVSRWETGARQIKALDYERAMEFIRNTSFPRIGGYEVSQSVARGTFIRESMQIPHRLAARFETLIREMIRAGATDAEVDFLSDVLRRPETARLIQTSVDAKPLPDRAVDEQWDALLDDFRAFVARRIDRRTPAPAQPIRPKDVPGLVAKRHAEVFGTPAKKKRAT